MEETQNPFVQEAFLYKQEGHHQKAVEHLQKAIISDLRDEKAYEELADNYLSLGETEKAEKALLYALKINPSSPNAHYLLGFLYSTQEKWDLSVDHLQKANQSLPHSEEIVRCLGWSFYHKGEKALGTALLERAYTLNPQDINILCDLGVCYMDQDYFESAEQIFKNVISLDPGSPQARECRIFLEKIQEAFDKFKH